MLGYMADEEQPFKRNATYQDVIDAPEHMVAEILDGDLFLSPRPAPRHAFSTTILLATIVPAFSHGFGGRGGWMILVEPELHIGPDVAVPDLAGWAARTHAATAEGSLLSEVTRLGMRGALGVDREDRSQAEDAHLRARGRELSLADRPSEACPRGKTTAGIRMDRP